MNNQTLKEAAAMWDDIMENLIDYMDEAWLRLIGFNKENIVSTFYPGSSDYKPAKTSTRESFEFFWSKVYFPFLGTTAVIGFGRRGMSSSSNDNIKIKMTVLKWAQRSLEIFLDKDLPRKKDIKHIVIFGATYRHERIYARILPRYGFEQRRVFDVINFIDDIHNVVLRSAIRNIDNNFTTYWIKKV